MRRRFPQATRASEARRPSRARAAAALALLLGGACGGDPAATGDGSAGAAAGGARARVPDEPPGDGAPPEGSRSAPRGARFLARLELPVPGKPTGLLADDLDGDGHAELVAATREPGCLAIWVGSAEGPLVPPRTMPVPDWPLGPVRLAPGNPGGAGGARIAVASQVTGELLVLSIGADGAAKVEARKGLGDAPLVLAAGDVGADGVPDVVVATRTALRWIAFPDDGPGGAPGDAPGPGGERGLEGERPTCLRVLGDGSIAVGFQAPREVAVHRPDGSGPATRHALPGIPRALLDADLDGDGDAELVVLGGDRGVWAFGLGAPGGSAGWSAGAVPRGFATTGLVPIRMQTADLDRDGSDELAVLHHHSLDLGVLGDFAADGPRLALGATSVGQTPADLALRDLDGDGRVDLAVANRDAQRVSLLRGTGFAAADRLVFYAAFQTPTGSDPVDVLAADLDGDGAPEVVTLDAVDETLTVLRNRYGLLREPSKVELGAGARRIEAGDLDGDGHADVAVLLERAEGAALRVLRGDGAGGLDALRAEERAFGRSGADLLVIDAGGDGRDDAWIADPAGQRVWWLASERGGDPGGVPFAEPRAVELGRAPFALAALPAAGASGATRIAAAFEEPGAGAGLALLHPAEGLRVELLPGRSADRRPVDLAAADVDGDGRADLVLLLRSPADSAPGRIATFLARGNGFEPGPGAATGALPRSLAAGDLDGDGLGDAVVAAQNSHHVNLWLAREGPLRLARQADLGVHLGPTRLALADLDGDGHPDVVVANTFSDDVSALYNVPAD